MKQKSVEYVDSGLFPDVKPDLYKMMRACPKDKVVRVSQEEFSAKNVASTIARLTRWAGVKFDLAQDEKYFYLRRSDAEAVKGATPRAGSRKAKPLYVKSLPLMYIEELTQLADKHRHIRVCKSLLTHRGPKVKSYAVGELRARGYRVDGSAGKAKHIDIFGPSTGQKIIIRQDLAGRPVAQKSAIPKHGAVHAGPIAGASLNGAQKLAGAVT